MALFAISPPRRMIDSWSSIWGAALIFPTFPNLWSGHRLVISGK
jgi:hypothetical protein